MHVAQRRLVGIGVPLIVVAGTIFCATRYVRSSLIRTSPQAERAEMIRRHNDFLWKQLRIGMTKREVARIIGEPQNSDAKCVWMWIFGLDRFGGADTTWKELLASGSDGYFVVFLDGVLRTKIYAISATSPQEEVMVLLDISEEEALSIIADPP